MGYTHYWDMLDHTDEQWQSFTDEWLMLYRNTHADTTLSGPLGEEDSVPECTNERVAFNGIDDNAYESFIIDRVGDSWTFCKTARKPYDAWVVACLIIGERHGILTWRSDGDDKYDDFSSAYRLLEHPNNPTQGAVMRQRPIGIWYDSSSYSRGERGNVEPTCYSLPMSRGEVIVHRYLNCDGWFVSCHTLQVSRLQLDAADIESAKREALDRCLLIANAIGNDIMRAMVMEQ